jgi:general secretion pathway protein F
MPAFEYQAIDASGRTQRGVMQADTPRAARASLRDRGLNPLQIEAADPGSAGSVANRSALRGAQLALLTRQLATLVASGLPIDEALQALAEGSEGRLRTQVVSLRSRVMEGASLANAMAEYPETFPPLFRASVSAGESAGKLDRVLLRLADYAETRDALRRRILLALTYPLLLTVVALAVVSALMIWVVPQVIGVFTQQQQALPLPTQILILISGVLRDYGGAIAATLIGVAAITVLALRRPQIRANWHGTLLKLPLLGRLVRAADTARFARTLALLVGSAVPLLEALGIAAQVVENASLKQALGRVSVRVREGQPFAKALAETREFPPVAVRLIASGEKSGRLDEMLFEAASHQERELDTSLGIAMAALGPGVILIVGGVVLFIVLAILLPIFELNTLIR